MIEIKNLFKNFSNKEVLKDVSFTIEEGDIFGIVGHSGAGKSTLLRCLNGLENYTEGSIRIDGKEVRKLNSYDMRHLRKGLGMIFQNFNLMTSKNVFQNIAFPMELWGYDKQSIDQRVNELLALVGLEDKKSWSVRKLSGGQKQRVGIARALALHPKILLCDEATSALDPKTTKSILQLLREINRKLNITIIIVTHQMEVIKEACNKVVLMEDGGIKGYGDVEELFLKPTEELDRLLGEEELLPVKGVNIKLFFSKECSENSIITSMARELDVDFSIVWGKLEKFRDDVLGSLVINVEEAHKDRIVKYLQDKGIGMEVL
jgi:D-methionine transport system ATP-binding protein